MIGKQLNGLENEEFEDSPLAVFFTEVFEDYLAATSDIKPHMKDANIRDKMLELQQKSILEKLESIAYR